MCVTLGHDKTSISEELGMIMGCILFQLFFAFVLFFYDYLTNMFFPALFVLTKGCTYLEEHQARNGNLLSLTFS